MTTVQRLQYEVFKLTSISEDEVVLRRVKELLEDRTNTHFRPADYAHLPETARTKIDRLLPLIQQRSAEAEREGYLPDLTPNLHRTLNSVLLDTATNPEFTHFSFDVHTDGGLELTMLDADKRNIDYYVFFTDTEHETVKVVFSRYQDRKPILKLFGSLEEVRHQLMKHA